MPDMNSPTTTEARDTATEVAAAAGGVSTQARSLGKDALHDLIRNPLFIASAILIVMFIVMAIRPQLFTSIDPHAQGACLLPNTNKPPSVGHWFGYNLQGCDVFARSVYGARASIMVGIFVTIFATFIGSTIGILAGYFGGWADAVLSRFTDIFLGLPIVLGALVFMGAFPKRNIWTVILAISVLGWTSVARISRGAVLTVKESDYVTAARALGAGHRRIILRHILPNAVAPIIVVATINLGIFIVLEATLSFLGLGLPPSVMSWGNDISAASPYLRTTPHALLFPAGLLSLTVLSFIMLGDAVRDALDPKLR